MNATMLPRLSTRVGFAVVAVFIIGCGAQDGPPTGSLTGKLTYHGDPVTNAEIHLNAPKRGTHGMAVVGTDGTYSIPYQIEEGTYRVFVTPPSVIDKADGSPPPAPIDNPKIPAKYRRESTSGLTIEIHTGDNKFDIAMQD
jgi:hypothetical protein